MNDAAKKTGRWAWARVLDVGGCLLEDGENVGMYGVKRSMYSCFAMRLLNA